MTKKIDTTAIAARKPGRGADTPVALQPQTSTGSKRVLDIPITDIVPDPSQPRAPLLPLDLRAKFMTAELSSFEVAREWLNRTEQDEDIKERIDFFLNMAQGFGREDISQINPITSVELGDNHWGASFMIETGEQRFWAATLHFVKHGQEGDVPTLRLSLVKEISPLRQVIENRHVGAPSAVSVAREIATVLISEGFAEVPAEILAVPAHERDPYAVFRAVARPKKRAGVMPQLSEIMQLDSQAIQRYLRILRLPTDILQEMDIVNFPARRIRAVLTGNEAEWVAKMKPEIIRWRKEEKARKQGKDGGSEQGEITEQKPRPSAAEKAGKAFKRFATLFLFEPPSANTVKHVVSQLISDEQKTVAIENLRFLADEIEQSL